MKIVSVEPTPNPDALKFVLESVCFESRRGGVRDQTVEPPDELVTALLRIDGVSRVFMTRDFITLTRTPGSPWGPIRSMARRVIARAVPG